MFQKYPKPDYTGDLVIIWQGSEFGPTPVLLSDKQSLMLWLLWELF